MTRLLIVVSNTFRQYLKDYSVETTEFELGKNRLLVHGHDEKAWLGDLGLRNELLALLKTRQERSVRILAHLSVCFVRECNQSAFQVRVIDQEAEMKNEAEVDDLEIWGFRHEKEYSRLWNVLSQVVVALAGPGLDEKTAEQLGAELDRAFSEGISQDAFEQVTLIRHQVLGLFVSARLSLEVAAERGKGGATASLERMRNVLPAKKAEALRILDDGMTQLDQVHRATSHKLRAEKAAVEDVLNGLPPLDAPESASEEFNGWLSRLDDSLEQLRRRCC